MDTEEGNRKKRSEISKDGDDKITRINKFLYLNWKE